MDFELNDDQEAILGAVEALLEKHAGAARAIALQPKAGYDFELDAALREAGFTDVAEAEGAGPLEAALITEAVARSAGVVAYAASALVVPGLVAKGLEVAGPVALTTTSHNGPIRFGAQAATLLVLDTEQGHARVVSLAAGESEPVASNFGYPMGSFPESLAGRGESLGPEAGERLRAWWSVALAAEAAGTMGAALDQTTEYLKQRKQFGRAIGSFQAVQHRLAECAIEIEASRWLACEAAFHGAPAEGAATAASYALTAARRVFSETHQLSGAIGFTREHDLHVWSMRLQALRQELGGVSAHRRALARARWGNE